MRRRILAVAVSLMCAPAFAGVTICAGGKSVTSTYTSFANSIKSVCADQLQISVVESSGSDANIQRLMGKDSPKCDVALVQTDVLQFTATQDSDAGDNNIKALMVLYPEEVHVVVKQDLKVGGTLGLFAKPPTELADLRGKVVGSWGGSYTTARSMNAQAALGLEIRKYENDADAKKALDSGAVAGLVVTGGQPMGFVKDLKQGYNLLAISPVVAASMSYYVPAKLNYPNISPTSIASIATPTLLAVVNARSPTKRAEFSLLKKCVEDNLDEFREGDHHAKWKLVDPKANSVRSFYETVPVPSAQTIQPTVKSSKK